MSILESVRVALQVLQVNKLRSGLTMLGIVIGVAAVIAMVAVGAGTREVIIHEYQSLGSNLLIVSPGSFQAGAGRTIRGQGLTDADVQAISRLATTVTAIAPEYTTSGQVAYGNKRVSTTILGVTPAYLTVRNWQVARGRFVNEQDAATLAKVCVLGAGLAEALFGEAHSAPPGEVIRIDRQSCLVVGVMASKGQTAFMTRDDQLFMPLTTTRIRFGGVGDDRLSAINVQVRSQALMNLAQAELTAILRARHGLRSGQPSDFEVQNQAELLESVRRATASFTILLGSIAAISLLVGGIGVMNIMLVSVTERTREIGIRRAVGARQRDILLQFLVEAVTMTMMGGVVGIMAGTGIAHGISRLRVAGVAIEALIDVTTVTFATLFCIAIGLFFGIYPAVRAARLKPIDALRYE